MVKLGDFMYKRNTFLDYLDSQKITLYLNTSPFINKNRVVDRVIRTIRDRLYIRENLWLDTDYIAVLVEDYNHTPPNDFMECLLHFKFNLQEISKDNL
jgi:hypothetical protein